MGIGIFTKVDELGPFAQFCMGRATFLLQGTRQEESFAACILSSLLHAFPLRAALEFLFLFFAALDPGGCQGEGLTQTALSGGAPGSLVCRRPPGKVGGRGVTGTGACGTFLRCVRVDPQGWGVADAAEKEVCHHMHHSTHTHRERTAHVRTHMHRAHSPRKPHAWPPWLTTNQGGM